MLNLNLPALHLTSFLSCLLQENKDWAETDPKGRPVNDACLDCYNGLLRGWPGVTWADSSERIKNDEAYKNVFLVAVQLFKKYQKKAGPFHPEAFVSRTVKEGVETYFEVAFVSESELQELTGVTPKQLKLSEYRLDLEQHGQSLKGYFLSLEGLTETQMRTLRRVKIFSRGTLTHEEVHVTPDSQLQPDQGKDYFGHLSSLVSDSYPTEWKASQRHRTPTLHFLVNEGAKIIQEGWVGLTLTLTLHLTLVCFGMFRRFQTQDFLTGTANNTIRKGSLALENPVSRFLG